MDNKYYLQTKFKSVGFAYVMWFFLGLHHAYLGNWGRQFLLWLLWASFGVGFFLALQSFYPEWVFGICVGLSGIGVLWYLLDVFFIAAYVNSYNRRIADKIQKIELMEQAAQKDEQRLAGYRNAK
jgi:hypothetical protein